MKKTKIPSLITLLILTLLTSVVWISLSVYRAITSQPAPSVPESVSKPLTPNLDTKTMNDLGSKIFLEDSQIPEVKTIPQATVIPTPISTPISTPEATPSATP